MKQIKYLITVFTLIFLFNINSYSQPYNVPEILYYKFNTGTSTTPNLAVPGQGTSDAVITGQTLGPGGQFGNALLGSGGTASANNCNSGWNMNLGASSWTISLWIGGIPASGTYYLFGNDFTTSFRCFTNGAAGAGNITLQGNGLTNVIVTGVLPGPSVVHFVYDATIPAIKTYVNGVFQNTTNQSALNLNATVPFKVGAYGTANSLPIGGIIDEFRFYNRAVGAAEITATWNVELPTQPTGIENPNTVQPSSYNLSQNYPNPFNPTTKIMYSIPKAGLVKVKIFDMLGNEVKTLVNEIKNHGEYSVDFDGRDFSSGIYLYKLEAGDFSATKKMMLVK